MRRLLAALVLLVLVTRSLQALYMRPDLEHIPVSRLIANLTRAVAGSPRDATLQFNLARAHAMAWAQTDPDVEVAAKTDELWFGFEPRPVPFTPRRDAKTPESDRHLGQAIEHHRIAASLKPGDLTMQLGYAWCLDQAGRTSEAVALYRRIVSEAWPQEKTATSTMNLLAWYSVTGEAAGYLLPHLDPNRDAAEIADLKGKVATLDRLPRPITPIVIPLDDHRRSDDIVDASAAVLFDLDGSGRARRWQWISPRYGWLVYDHAGSGRIDSALQLFGSVTFWMFWNNGYAALAALDDDGDGRLAGSELLGLAIWADANGDGRSDRSEVRSLAQHGIVGLSCASSAGGRPDIAAFSLRGATFADGRTRPTFDVVLSPAVPRQLTLSR